MGGEIQITDDLTLTAHWTANTYTVQYRGQSSLHTLLPDVTYSTQLCTYDAPFTMPGRPQSISLNPRKTKRRHQACENEKSSVHNLKSVMNTRYGPSIHNGLRKNMTKHRPPTSIFIISISHIRHPSRQPLQWNHDGRRHSHGQGKATDA